MADDVVAIVARSGYAADGVVDHASVLTRESTAAGLTSSVVFVDWRSDGWPAAMTQLRNELTTRQPKAVTLHYSTLAWSRRGLPFAFIALTAALRTRYRVLVWVHDPLPHESGLKGAVRERLTSSALALVSVIANAVAVSIRPQLLRWARSRFVARKVTYCASPTNIASVPWHPPHDMLTVATFGIAVGTEPHEVAPLRAIARSLHAAVGPFRLRLLGARATNDKPPLAHELEAAGVTCDVPGSLDSDALADRLAASHIFLFVRYELSTRSGTLAAALACGLPIAGGTGPETSDELAAVALTRPFGEWAELAEAIAVVAHDNEALATMSTKSSVLAATEYSWEPGVALLRSLLAR